VNDTWDKRLELLRRLFKTVHDNCASGALLGEPVNVRGNSICGPRAGALELTAGAMTGPLMSKLAQHDHALLRQMVPWDFPGDPAAFMRGRYVRLETGWPDGLAETMVRLDELGQCPGDRSLRWTVGVNEHGARVTTSLSPTRAHFLFAGMTGSGKTIAARNAVLQLAQGENQLVLCDGKRGESLHMTEHWHGVVGPLATDRETVRDALGWVYAQMMDRYERIKQGLLVRGAIVVVFDEFQAFTDDAVIAALMREIASMGRAGNVHLLIMTQQPTLAQFGKDERSRTTTRRQMAGRIALQVADYDASRVVVGSSTPRADRLLGAGDAYLLASGGIVHRVQCAYVDERDFRRAETGTWQFDEWPHFDPADIGEESAEQSSGWDDTEAAIGILTAAQGNRGRPTLLELFDEYERARPGTDKARRLLAWGRDVWQVLRGAPELVDYCRGMTD
jgi:DNA segregation ATPase FtsK/SpoIIIE-like protein